MKTKDFLSPEPVKSLLPKHFRSTRPPTESQIFPEQSTGTKPGCGSAHAKCQQDPETDSAHYGTTPVKVPYGTGRSSILERLLHETEAAKLLGVSVHWLRRARWAGTGPGYVKVGGPSGRAVRYETAELQRYGADNRRAY
jgi:hypothetical protein